MARSLRNQPGTIVGLDVSLTGAAACALRVQKVFAQDSGAPIGWRWWSCDDPVHTVLVGYPLGVDASQDDRIVRIAHIVDALCGFVQKHGARYVYVEGYAFSARSSSVTKLAEVGGALRYALHTKLSVTAQEMTASRARTYLLGRLPRGRGTQKPACRDALARARFVFGSMDECDAFCIANCALGELGGCGVTFATPVV